MSLYKDDADFTVIDVFRELDVETDKKLTVSAGLVARYKFEEITGSAPVKDLRTKTCGEGVHCFAIYPYWFRKVVRDIVQNYKDHKAAQPDLFGYDHEPNHDQHPNH